MSNKQEQVKNNYYFYTKSKLSSINSKHYRQISQPSVPLTPSAQIFCSEWQRFPEFHAWLRPVEGNIFKAWCIACHRSFNADLKSLRLHGFSKSHLRQMYGFCINDYNNYVPPVEYNVVTDEKITYSIAEVTNNEDISSCAFQELLTNQTNPAEKTISEMTTQSKHDKNVVVLSPNEDYDCNVGIKASSSNTEYVQIEMNVIDMSGNLVSVATEYHVQKNKGKILVTWSELQFFLL